jgi:hypothetical protein
LLTVDGSTAFRQNVSGANGWAPSGAYGKYTMEAAG